MDWIVRRSPDVAVDGNQLQARSNYILDVTDANVTKWRQFRIDGQLFFTCVSDDNINGIFITAHIGDIVKLCLSELVTDRKFVVANTCIWEGLLHKKLLSEMRRDDQEIELLFAKQELFVDNRVLRQTTTAQKVGEFGFQTTLSERELFRNRKEGLETAIRNSFERVSPIVLPGDLL